MNFPNHVKAWLSSSVNRYINFSNWFNSTKFLYWLHILSNRPWRSSELHSHSIIKWNSSSTVLHMEHSLWWAGVFGFVYLPRSISNEWELVRNLAIAVRYLKFLTLYRYGSVPYLVLIKLYVFKIGCAFTSLSDVRHSLMWCSVTARLHCWLKFCLGPNMSILYNFESSVTLEIQLGKPFSCNLSNSQYTCLDNLVSDIWYIRLKKHSKDMWQKHWVDIDHIHQSQWHLK